MGFDGDKNRVDPEVRNRKGNSGRLGKLFEERGHNQSHTEKKVLVSGIDYIENKGI